MTKIWKLYRSKAKLLKFNNLKQTDHIISLFSQSELVYIFRLFSIFLFSRSRFYGYFIISPSKYSRNPQKAQIITKVSISLEKSRSRLKSKVLANLIETKSRNLDLDRDFSIVETNFWKPSRLSIMARLILFWRWDRESRSRPRRDKSRPPSLLNYL